MQQELRRHRRPHTSPPSLTRNLIVKQLPLARVTLNKSLEQQSLSVIDDVRRLRTERAVILETRCTVSDLFSSRYSSAH